MPSTSSKHAPGCSNDPEPHPPGIATVLTRRSLTRERLVDVSGPTDPISRRPGLPPNALQGLLGPVPDRQRRDGTVQCVNGRQRHQFLQIIWVATLCVLSFASSITLAGATGWPLWAGMAIGTVVAAPTLVLVARRQSGPDRGSSARPDPTQTRTRAVARKDTSRWNADPTGTPDAPAQKRRATNGRATPATSFAAMVAGIDTDDIADLRARGHAALVEEYRADTTMALTYLTGEARVDSVARVRSDSCQIAVDGHVWELVATDPAIVAALKRQQLRGPVTLVDAASTPAGVRLTFETAAGRVPVDAAGICTVPESRT